jgi:hypothetical protein
MYARLFDDTDEIQTYPFPLTQLKNEHPHTSFPREMDDTTLYAYRVVRVTLAPQPEHDLATQGIAETPPQLIDGVWTQTWAVHDRTQDEIDSAFANLIALSLVQIDADTDAIYGAKLGHRAQEYILAEEEATAFAAAGYTGTVPHSVHCWAVPKGWTAQQAADDILATATAWRGAQASIREKRLAAKEAVRNATDSAGVETAMAEWAGFCSVIRGQLGL